MKIIIAGGSGFIGEAIVAKFSHQDHHILILSRHPEQVSVLDHGSVKVFSWLNETSPPLENLVEGADVIINLAGTPLMKTWWTRSRKKQILSSRLDASKALAEALHKTHKKPGLVITASAVGWYGHRPFGDVTETAPKGSGFLAMVCEAWEQESRALSELGIRSIQLRLGTVLEAKGGMLKLLAPIFKAFVGGPPGDGSQWLSWVHRDDVANAIAWIMTHPDLEGPVNLTSPEPVQMKKFCIMLGKILKRPSWVSVPAWVLRWLLQDTSEVMLAGAKVIPEKLILSGFVFQYPHLQEALQACFCHEKSHTSEPEIA